MREKIDQRIFEIATDKHPSLVLMSSMTMKKGLYNLPQWSC